MNNEMAILQKTFKKEGLGQIRIARLNDKLMFNLYDSCFHLGYTRQAKNKLYLRKDKITNICKSIDIKGLSLGDNFEEINFNTDFENTWISEQNFYDLCLESHAKNARPFRRWVTGEVLPSIRKTGKYETDNVISFDYKLEKLKLEQQGLKLVVDLLKPSKASTVKILRNFNESQGLSTAYFPVYVDEKAGTSATSLLRKFDISMSTIKFNKLMLEHGFLEENERKSTKGTKKYWTLTEKGLKYGKNLVNDKGSEKETQPLYYENTFMELINFLGCSEGVM
mgnify:CR=1 FL=1|jgi:prophage antirepressor-like protein